MLPTYLLGFVIATIYGSAFHLWKNGGLGRLFLYIFFSWIGFWVGQYIGNRNSITIIEFGSLNLVIASLGSLLFLMVGHWLIHFDTNE